MEQLKRAQDIKAELIKSPPPSVCKTSDFDVARVRLGNFIVSKVNALCKAHEISYEENDDLCANTYEELRNNVASALLHIHPLYVMKSASDKSIYTSPHYVWALRCWHEWLHYTLSADFSAEGEFIVNQEHLKAVEAEFGVGSLEAKLCITETHMQVMYFAMHGEFVDDQLAFAEAMVQKY